MKIWKKMSSVNENLIATLNELQRRPGVEIRTVVYDDDWEDYNILYTTEEDEEKDDEDID